MMTNKNEIPKERLLQLAQWAIANMFNYDRYNAIDECRFELTDAEWDLLNIDEYNDVLIEEGYYTNPYTGEKIDPRTGNVIKEEVKCLQRIGTTMQRKL